MTEGMNIDLCQLVNKWTGDVDTWDIKRKTDSMKIINTQTF